MLNSLSLGAFGGPVAGRERAMSGRPHQPDRPTFTLKLRAEPGVEAVPALRRMLKVALRRWGLRALSVESEAGPFAVADPPHAEAAASRGNCGKKAGPPLRPGA